MLVAGCGRAIFIDGREVSERRWVEAAETVRDRAGFDFQCDPRGIQLTLVAVSGRRPSVVGAAGCGHRTTYSRVGYQWFARDEGNAAGGAQQGIDEAQQQQQVYVPQK